MIKRDSGRSFGNQVSFISKYCFELPKCHTKANPNTKQISQTILFICKLIVFFKFFLLGKMYIYLNINYWSSNPLRGGHCAGIYKCHHSCLLRSTKTLWVIVLTFRDFAKEHFLRICQQLLRILKTSLCFYAHFFKLLICFNQPHINEHKRGSYC